MLLYNFNLKSWDIYFKGVKNGVLPGKAYYQPPTLGREGSNALPASVVKSQSISEPDVKTIEDHLCVQAIIRSYQVCFTDAYYMFGCIYV